MLVNDLVREALTEMNLTDEDRAKDLAERRYDGGRPVLNRFASATFRIGVDARECPHPAVDATLFAYLNTLFTFPNTSEEIIVLPLPIFEQKAFIETAEGVLVIVVSEFEVLYSETLFMNLHDPLSGIDEVTIQTPEEECRRFCEELKDLGHRDLTETAHELAVEHGRIFLSIVRRREEFSSLIPLEKACLALVIPSTCFCHRISANLSVSQRFEEIFTFTPPADFVFPIWFTERVSKMMAGYLFRLVAHEFSHHTQGHMDDEGAETLWPHLKHTRADGLEDVAREVEADVVSAVFWRDFAKQTQIGKDDIYPYVGMFMTMGADFLRATVEYKAQKSEIIDGFEAWLCRQFGRVNSYSSPLLNSEYPTDLERFEESTTFPSLCAASTASPSILQKVLRCTASLYAILQQFDERYDLDAAEGAGVRYTCSTCQDVMPIHAANSLLERVEAFNHLPEDEKEKLRKAFKEYRSDPDGISVKLSDKNRKALRDILSGKNLR